MQVNFKNNFNFGNAPVLLSLQKKLMSKPQKIHRYIRIGNDYEYCYPSSYRADYFEKLAREAANSPEIQKAKAMQEVFDQREYEDSFLRINIP